MIFGQTVCFSVGVASDRMALRQRLMRACIGPLVLALARSQSCTPRVRAGAWLWYWWPRTMRGSTARRLASSEAMRSPNSSAPAAST
jgi:hypothetical protein